MNPCVRPTPQKSLLFGIYNTYCFLKDIFAVNTTYFSIYIIKIYPEELNMNKGYQDSSSFLFFWIKMFCYIIYKRDSFLIFNFPFPDQDIHLANSYRVYISRLVHLYSVCKNVLDFNECYFKFASTK